MPEEKKYTVIDVSHLKAPIGCWGALYRELKILSIFQQRAEELQIGHKNYILPQHILCNDKTCQKLLNIIRESWEWYAINRRTGEFRRQGTYIRHKKKTPIHRGDESALAMDALCWSPSIREEVPDDVLWLDLDLRPIRSKEEMENE